MKTKTLKYPSLKRNKASTTIRILSALGLLFYSLTVKSQCAPNFTYTLGTGGTATFVSTSTGTTANTTYTWSFANNSYINTTPSITFTFPDNLVYPVTLDIDDNSTTPVCNSTLTKTVGISTAPCFTNAALQSQQLQNGAVRFITYPEGSVLSGYSYSWGFGDASGSSVAEPIHTYTVNGNYNVTVTAISYSATCTYSIAQTVSVIIVSCPNAGFNYTLNANNHAHFAATSPSVSNVSTYFWDFDDGYSNYASDTISHTFATPGPHQVKLSLHSYYGSLFNCSDSVVQTVSVPNTTCNASSNFILNKDTTQLFHWQAVPYYPLNVGTVEWSWGDGSTSTGLYPSHTYSSVGYYNICLTVTATCGSISQVCRMQSLAKIAADMLYVNVVAPPVTTGVIENVGENIHLQLFPNPSRGILYVGLNVETNVSEIEVFDLLGKKVCENNSFKNGEPIKIDLSSLNNGIYFLQLKLPEKKISSKFILSK